MDPRLAANVTEVRSNVGRADAAKVDRALLERVVAADTAFGTDLFRAVAAESEGNVFLSPYSISTALSMALAGARGQTADQLAAALGITGATADWHTGRNALEHALATPPKGPFLEGAQPLTLTPANALFGQAGYAFEHPFLDTLAADYGAGLQAVDFVKNSEDARAAINEWVAAKTRDRIAELMGPGSVSSDTRLVAVNAIYFKASWAKEFVPALTKASAFHQLDGSAVSVPFMNGQVSGAFGRGDGWTAVRVPYLGASMTIVVPDAGRYDEVAKAFGPKLLADVDASLAPARVDLRLPKWASTSEFSLAGTLAKLGITDLFDPSRADLSGITASEQLVVKDVIHEATITVDEHGTEAAAATGVAFEAVSGDGSVPQQLTVDRPFLYVIRDDASGDPLFLGRVLDPDSK